MNAEVRNVQRREVLVGMLAALGVAACGGSNGGGGSDGASSTPSAASSPSSGAATSARTGAGTGGTATQEVRGAAGRAAKVDPTGRGGPLLGMSVALHREVAAAAPGANLAFSPMSVAFTLAMTANGAKGETLAEMLGVLGTASIEGLNAALNDIEQALGARSGSRQFGPGRVGEVTLDLANSLWGQDGLRFEPAFLDALAASYGAGMHVVDYGGASEAARAAINAWVADATRDEIPELIPTGVLSAATRLVLVNAMYLKAPWQEPFPVGATAKQPFHLTTGSTVPVDMMAGMLERGAYASGSGWTAVELPYLGGELAMTVVVPDPGGWAAFETGLTAEVLAPMFDGLRRRAVSLRLPKWTTRTDVALVPVLQALGMQVAFGDGADFSAMTTQAQLYVSDVLQAAHVAVDEEGTEAAAATAVVMSEAAAAVDPPVEVVVDRPFFYAIRDAQSGVLLFTGRVLDPTRT